jgi:signal transduction histidine kinase
VTIRDTNVPPPELSILRHPPTVRSMICAPLLLGSPERGEYFGNLTVLMEAPDQVLEVDRLLLEGLAQQLALTLHRLHLAEDRLRAEESAYENDKLALVGQFALEVLHRWGNETRPIRVAVNSIRRQIEASGVASAVIEQELRTILEDWEQSRRVLRMLNEDPQEARALLAKSHVPRKISVTNLLNNAIKLYPYNPASIEVIVEPPARAAYLFARKQEATNILRNLFMNAVQAQPNGGRIVLRALVELTVVRIEVEDSGPGIAEEHQQRIFEPNYTTKEGGTGFGLFSARRYARLNNGELTLRSTPGAGCTFVLTLPLFRPRLQRSHEGEGDPA